MLKVTPIEAFSDNYIWCIENPGDPGVYVVDPGDALPVKQHLEARGLELAGVLITHHHFDHTGGLDGLLEGVDVPVYGPENPGISQLTHRLGDGDRISILGANFDVITVPGHTLDHIAFFHDADQPLLFCGDTLFAGGCGRVFEGDPPMMSASLARLAALPGATEVYCAHEYTMGNLAFAAAVEPDNQALQARIDRDRRSREENQPTVPSTLALELDTNPFLRCAVPGLAQSMQERDGIDASDPIAVFAAVRGWKDNF